MKKFYLSTKAERIKGLSFSLVIAILLAALLFALRNNLGTFLLVLPCAVLIAVFLVLYVVIILKSACYPDLENNKLRVGGMRERSIDLSNVTSLETITARSGHVQSRSLAFSNAEGDILEIVPTCFTFNNGALAEPMAKELAQVLNLNFIANVPEWEYDEEARKAHDIEVAQQAKEDAKARKEAKKALREAKIRKRMEKMSNEDKK